MTNDEIIRRIAYDVSQFEYGTRQIVVWMSWGLYNRLESEYVWHEKNGEFNFNTIFGCKLRIVPITGYMWVVGYEGVIEKRQECETMDKLKPCPFCGGEARLLLNAKRKIYGKDEYKTGVVACCNVCEARMFYASEELAIKAWNRRADND